MNLKKLVTFYDPHSGAGGAIMRIPSAVSEIAKELEGKTLSLQEAIEKIKNVTEGEVTPDNNYKMIVLEIQQGTIRQSFCVIKYRGAGK